MSFSTGTKDPCAANAAVEKYDPLLPVANLAEELCSGASAKYGSVGDGPRGALLRAVSDHPCVFHDIFRLMHKGCPIKRRANLDPYTSQKQSESGQPALSIEPDLEEPSNQKKLTLEQKKFLLQICACLMATPTSVALYVTQCEISAPRHQFSLIGLYSLFHACDRHCS
jgi:hypothetical protein